MGGILESGSAKRARRRASEENVRQQKKEKIRLADVEDELGRRRAEIRSGKAGRQSLIKTSPTGLATNLGGTNAP